jgi:hypothetical protein
VTDSRFGTSALASTSAVRSLLRFWSTGVGYEAYPGKPGQMKLDWCNLSLSEVLR